MQTFEMETQRLMRVEQLKKEESEIQSVTATLKSQDRAKELKRETA